MAENNQRLTAKICTISDILQGQYVKQEGWEPNYIETHSGQFSRVNIMCSIIDKSDQRTCIVDDGTGSIRVTMFDGTLPDVKIGDAVILIGRPREFNGERFLVPEILKQVSDPAWLLHRKAILPKAPPSLPKDNSEEKFISNTNKVSNTNNINQLSSTHMIENVKNVDVQTENIDAQTDEVQNGSAISRVIPLVPAISNEETVLRLIRKIDSGSGASIDEIIESVPNAERILKRLTEEGTIFSIKPGFVKVL